ncbi:MAG: hypothetical protein ABJG68_17050 [Crocinitomicaceae bacterium]
MKSTIRINEGLTYEYLIHGIMTILGGVIVGFSFFQIPIIGIAIGVTSFFAGIFMCISKTGIEINQSKKTVRKYVDWTVFKTGTPHPLDRIIKIELKYNSQHSPTVRPIYMDKGDTTAKTYDLILTNDLEQTFLLNGFTKVSLALKTFESLDKMTDIPMENKVIDMLKKQKAHRKRR